MVSISQFPAARTAQRTGDGCPGGFVCERRGVFWLRRRAGDGEDAEIERIRISGPVRVVALSRDEHGQSWGRVLEWRDQDGRDHKRAIPAQRFHETGHDLASELAADGLEIVPSRERKLMEYLGSFGPRARVLCVDALGWRDATDQRLTFVLPERVIGAQDEQGVVFQPERFSPTARTIRAAGALEAWQTAVAQRVLGNPLLMFGLCSGLAGPLVKPTGLDGGGFHLFGMSSRGKTTWLQVAASVWGCGGDPGQAGSLALLRRWTVTANGAEGLAAAHNDLVLPLDEIGSCQAKDFGGLVYLLAGGQGKAAMDASRALKDVRTWRTILLSTGEISSRQKIEEDQQRRARAGQLLRLTDIPAGDQIICCTYGRQPADFVDELKAACGTFYGTAGPAFIERMLAQAPEAAALRGLVELVQAMACTELTPTRVSPEVVRSSKRFALVATAGILACRWGVLPWPEDRVMDAVRQTQALWLANADTLTDLERGVQAVRDFCLRYPGRFQPLGESRVTGADLAGYRAPGAFLFTPAGFQEACGGFETRMVARELATRTLLEISEQSRLTMKCAVPGLEGRVRLYCVKEAIVEDGRDG